MIASKPQARYLRVGLGVFTYTVAASLLIQLVLLPYVFPAWHAGHGLIAGGDMPGYHKLAVKQAELIRQQGWSAWTLRPDGQAPAGIASALYVLVAPEPWTMTPLHAALHAAAGILLYAILLRFWPHPRAALVAAGPLVLFPSAALWYSQLGKDGFSIAGYLAIASGWALLVHLPKRPTLRHFGAALGLILTGAVLVWVVRPYALEMIWVVSAVAAIMAVTVLVLHRVHFGLGWRSMSVGLVTTLLAFFVLWQLGSRGYEPEAPPSSAEPVGETGEPAAQTESAIQPTSAPASGNETYVGTVVWERSGWLPRLMDDRLYSLAVARAGFTKLFPLAASNVDSTATFNSAVDVIEYIPRAAELALLYPTPAQWFGEGSLPQNTVMRRISGLEMLVVYLGLALLPLAVWRWRRRLDFWLLVLFSLGMLVVHGLVVANIGTLYRLRYPYLLSLVCVGLLAGWAWLADRRDRRTRMELRSVEG